MNKSPRVEARAEDRTETDSGQAAVIPQDIGRRPASAWSETTRFWDVSDRGPLPAPALSAAVRGPEGGSEG